MIKNLIIGLSILTTTVAYADKANQQQEIKKESISEKFKGKWTVDIEETIKYQEKKSGNKKDPQWREFFKKSFDGATFTIQENKFSMSMPQQGGGHTMNMPFTFMKGNGNKAIIGVKNRKGETEESSFTLDGQTLIFNTVGTGNFNASPLAPATGFNRTWWYVPSGATSAIQINTATGLSHRPIHIAVRAEKFCITLRADSKVHMDS